MGKHKPSNLGRSLVKDRFGSKARSKNDDCALHTSDLKDGYEWNRLNLQSVTEENSFQEFLSTAELAGTEFTAEKLNVTFVNPRSGVGLLSNEEKIKASESHKIHRDLLKIPRRPKWDSATSTEELQTKERQDFLEWRRKLALFQENTGLLLTPYEKNLDFWRQLWRVVERSDVIVQIVDARNPLIFRCEDLEEYVKEVDESKLNVILCNKADFLTRQQRKHWAKYFDSINVTVAFFSATSDPNNTEDEDSDDEDALYDEEDDYETEEEEEFVGDVYEEGTVISKGNTSKLLSREKLIQFLREYPRQRGFNKDLVTIGLVGYPNVGKSSTINTLLTYKKVPTSATPGKTKHFQTVYLDKDILLCDCPGLVMPSFVLTKADMVLNGILPIDRMRDHVPSVNLLCTLIPRHLLEHKYSIFVPKPDDGEDPNRPPHSEELLNAYAYSRGFMTSHGQPDNARAARYVLKDFVNGRLLYCYAPPSCNQDDYHVFPKNIEIVRTVPPQTMRAIKPCKTYLNEIDQKFFKAEVQNAHVKGIPKYYQDGIVKKNQYESEDGKPQTQKPWKNHKEKRNTHQKLRKKYRYLDG